MTRVAVIGMGYVGTVTAVGLAWLGHDVVGLHLDCGRVHDLAAGQVPFFEPGLQEILSDTLATGSLAFTSDGEPATGAAETIFLCAHLTWARGYPGHVTGGGRSSHHRRSRAPGHQWWSTSRPCLRAPGIGCGNL